MLYLQLVITAIYTYILIPFPYSCGEIYHKIKKEYGKNHIRHHARGIERDTQSTWQPGEDDE